MLYSNDRQTLRQFYAQSWRDFLDKKPLEPLAQQVVQVIGEHPEYQSMIECNSEVLARDYLPDAGETNPFLHMGLHLAIREQVSLDRPPGIRRCFQTLQRHLSDALEAEHHMMDCLAEALWQSQKYNQLPDEAAYLSCLQTKVFQTHSHPTQGI
jgi:hypothetical protein